LAMSLQTPTTIRSRPNKLYGKAKATPIGRRRGPAVKSVGKPDALIGHVRFDERGRETERLAKPQAAAPFLDSTPTFREFAPDSGVLCSNTTVCADCEVEPFRGI